MSVTRLRSSSTNSSIIVIGMFMETASSSAMTWQSFVILGVFEKICSQTHHARQCFNPLTMPVIADLSVVGTVCTTGLDGHSTSGHPTDCRKTDSDATSTGRHHVCSVAEGVEPRHQGALSVVALTLVRVY